MDPLRSETCWSTFKYFIILIVSTCYILCIGWMIKCLTDMYIYCIIRSVACFAVYNPHCGHHQGDFFAVCSSGWQKHVAGYTAYNESKICISVLEVERGMEKIA